MHTFDDFRAMTPTQRCQYVKEHGLSIQQRKELLEANKFIAALFQMDAYWAGQKGRVERTLRFEFRW